MSRQIRVVISGGGTGGHIFPAIAIADALKELQPSIDILFIGAQNRMEMTRVPAAGYRIKGLWISGFQRKWGWNMILFPLKVLVSTVQAKLILLKFRPHIVIGVGGYSSGPVCLMARLLGIKTAIQEQNAFPGATNRMLGKIVGRIYTGYPEMERFFQGKKIKFFGNPVRKSISGILPNKEDAIRHFGLKTDRKTILVFGGSLGAGIFNECMDKAAELIEENSEKVQWIWQCGQMYLSQYKECRTAGMSNVWFSAFINDMDKAYAAADIVICRAGALAIAELAILGKAAILVPSPYVTADHQRMNALVLEKNKATIHLSQTEARELLIHRAFELLNNEIELNEIKYNIRKFGNINASEAIAEDLKNWVIN
jgi:UDP-N-acetylglucosamine--N-acetylmuramyl-(pentapeptide) pyrophosphoryl-undecaprenol N-acetylglucosamine transferase